MKDILLNSFVYNEPETPPTLHPLSLQRLVLASISCTTEDGKNVRLNPGNMLQPWVLTQLSTLVENTYDKAH